MSLNYSLQTGVSALASFTSGLGVIGDNIANVGTAGYKKSRADYEDNFSNLLKSSSTNYSQVGSGVGVASISTDFATEDAEYTGSQTDLAINGNGFFRVTEPISGQVCFTRSGNFQRNDNGYLVTPSGYRLQGSGTLGNGNDMYVPLTAVNPSSGQSESVTSWGFEMGTGKLKLVFSDGTKIDGGQVELSEFVNPEALIRQGGNMFQQTAMAGARNDFLPGENQAASVQSGYLELSNVDLTDEFAKMITTQRGFQAGSRIITTSDKLLEEAIQLKR